MKLRLSWTDPVSQRPRRPLLSAPIALGQVFTAMPEEISGMSVSRMVIGDRQVRDFQALLVEVEDELYLIDNGGQTFVNQQQVNGQERLSHGDRIRIGQTELQLQIMEAPPSTPGQRATHLQAIPAPTMAPSHDQSLAQNGNSNGKNGAHHLSHPSGNPNSNTNQINLPERSMTHANQNGNSHNGNPSNSQSLSRNGNSPALPPQIVPEPTPLNGHQRSDRPNQHNSHQYPPAHQPNGHLPPTNGHGNSNNIASPAQNSSQPTAPAPAFQTPIPSPAANPNPLQLPSNSPNAGCRRLVGFLFKRPCERMNSKGCDHCANGYSSHAYSADYELYEGFGRFEPGEWGYGLLEKQKKA